MLELNNILGLPKKVKGVGSVHPVTLSNYEEFMEVSYFLRMTKNHFQEEYQNLPLFELIVTYAHQTETMDKFTRMLEKVTGRAFELIAIGEIKFVYEDKVLNESNFEEFRKTVMEQNLLYEDKVFKNPMIKRWADKVLDARNKNSVDMSLEDIVSVVHLFTSIPYADIAKYTLFQLKHTFQRILKVEEQKQAIQFMIAGSKDTEIKPIMEKIELNQDPYADVFVDKSKLSNIKEIF